MSFISPASPYMPSFGGASISPYTPVMPMNQAAPIYPSALPSAGLGGSTLGGTGLSGDLPSALMQIMQMIMMLVMQLLESILGGGSNAGPQTGTYSQSLSAGGHGGGRGGHGGGYGGPGGFEGSQSGGYTPGPSNAPGNGNSNNGDSPSTGENNPSNGGGGRTSNSGSGAGWNKNVGVMASSSADKETVDYISGGHLVGGYLYELEKGMDSGLNIDQANAKAQQNSKDGAVSANVTPNSLVKGKGGNAVIVTGDNYPAQDADELASKLKKDYGMNVKVIHDASPKALKAAIQQMGGQSGQQCMVAVLAHGAKDDSGKKDGNIALGKGDGDQWLHESDLKSWVNQYLSPSYGNVNVLFNSCFSGNFAQ